MPRQGVARADRLRSLDALRGIAIAAMILVNNPGSDANVYAPLRHSDWHGCTAADLIFPFFLFVIGVAIIFSVGARGDGSGRPLRFYGNILRRALLLLALGIFLNGFPLFDWSGLRFPGVLQRIAVCYLSASLAAAALGPRALACLWAALVVGYWALLVLMPVPGAAAGAFDVDSNVAAWFDGALMSGHLLHETWDPEGLLSTLPAVATTLTGVLAGHWLRVPGSASRRVSGLLGAGLAGLLLGLLLDRWCPINKNLWTSSFVLFTGGAALCGLAACYWLIDVKGRQRWALPFVVYGSNPIVVYVLSSLIAKEMLLGHVARSDGTASDLQHYVFDSAFAPWASADGASLLYAVTYVLLWLALAAFLYRRGAYIKI